MASSNDLTEEDRLTIQRLIEERAQLRKRKRFEQADSIRTYLQTTHQIVLEENNDGTTKWYTEMEYRDAKHKKTENCRKKQRLKHFGLEEDSVISEMPLRNRRRMNRRVNAHRKKQKKRFSAFHKFLCNQQLLTVPSDVGGNFTPLVLDICGGNGSLSWEIVRGQMKNVRSVVVDPKCMRLTRFKSSLLVKEALGKQSDTIADSKPNANGSEDYLQCPWLHPKVKAEIVRRDDLKIIKNYYTEIGFGEQVISKFDSRFANENVNEKHAQLWKDADLILGLHPDQATDDIVEMSLSHRKVFAVVPCCVFPKLFSHRKLKDGTLVKSHPQLVQYLLERAEDILGNNTLSVPSLDPGKKYVVSSTVVENMPGPCNVCIYGKYVEH